MNHKSKLEKELLVRLSHVAHLYGQKKILNDLSLEIYTGDTVLIQGPSGVGKSTLLSLVGGLVYPTYGDIVIHPSLLPRESHFGYAFIDGPFFENLSVRDNIFLLQHFSDVIVDQAYYQSLLEYFEIVELECLPLISLSAGQRERVNFVRAFVHKPTIIIFDEPGVNLDTRLLGLFIQFLQENQKQQGCAYVIVSHGEEYSPLATHTISLSPI